MFFKSNRQKGFTLVELLTAVAVFAMILSFVGVIFKVSIKSQRLAGANGEIMEKYRAITEQLNADLRGLRKDGEICIVWAADRVADSNGVWRYVRNDRIVFYAGGDFQSYNQWPDANGDILSGNVARISYMLASNPSGKIPVNDPNCILSRTQHILVGNDDNLDDFPELNPFVDNNFRAGNMLYEYDEGVSVEGWKNINVDDKNKILTILCGDPNSTPSGGTIADITDVGTLHNILCEGVGEFSVQGWYEKDRRWVPEVDIDGDGDIADGSDFRWAADGNSDYHGLIYPFRTIGGADIGEVDIEGINYDPEQISVENFNSIPGLGRALKFVFTLYDSKGLIKGGRTFSHIVYLDD